MDGSRRVNLNCGPATCWAAPRERQREGGAEAAVELAARLQRSIDNRVRPQLVVVGRPQPRSSARLIECVPGGPSSRWTLEDNYRL